MRAHLHSGLAVLESQLLLWVSDSLLAVAALREGPDVPTPAVSTSAHGAQHRDPSGHADRVGHGG